MVNFCVGCDKEHDDWAWKYCGEYEGWVCSKYHRPSGAQEWIPENIRDERKEYFNATLQPFRNGELSKEYVDAHGTKGLDVTPDEASKARNVWSDLSGWSTRDKSK